MAGKISELDWEDDVDAPVWENEIRPLIAGRLFDCHSHVYCKEHAVDRAARPPNPSMPHVVDEFPHTDYDGVCDKIFPEVERGALVFGAVGTASTAAGSNAYVSGYCRSRPNRFGLAVYRFGAPAADLEAEIVELGLIGFKPYWTFVTEALGTPQNDVTLEAMVPDQLREAAERLGLILTVHIPRAGRLEDPLNVQGIRALCRDCPSAKVLLAHAGRSYCLRNIPPLAELSDLDNLYVDTSMIQNWEVYEFILQNFDRRRILFGFDFPVAQVKGKLIDVNGQRHFLTVRPYSWGVNNSAGAYRVKATLYAYEMLRALARAAERVGLGRAELDGLLYDNCAGLCAAVKSALAERNKG